MFGAAALVSAFALATTPTPQLSRNSLFGVKAGVFYPSSGALRSVMGGQWFSFGLSRVRGEAKGGNRVVTDIELIRHRDGANKVAMLTPTVSLLKDFAEPGATSFPYVAAGVGLTYFDYSLQNGTRYDSTKRFGPSLSLSAGYVFQGRFFVSARYNAMPSYDGYGFSGFTLSVGYGFIKF